MNLANAPVSWGVSEATGGRQPASAAMLGELAAAGDPRRGGAFAVV
jgi:hypothetical protein